MEEAGRGGIDDLEATLHRLVELVHPRHYLAMQVTRGTGEVPGCSDKLELNLYWLSELFHPRYFLISGEEDAVPDVRQLPVPPVGKHEGEGAEEEGGALPGVHRRLQHPRARPHQVEGQAL